jgi:hypothetical protein
LAGLSGRDRESCPVLFDDDAGQILRRFGVARVELVKGIGEDVGDCQIAEPIPVGRDDVPRRLGRRAARQGILVSGDVSVPARPLFEIAEPELPALLRIVEPGLEALALFVAVDVEEELEDRRSFLAEQALEGVDLVVAARPDSLRGDVMDPDDEDVLVVRSIEDGDLALAGRSLVHAPEEVVSRLDRCGHLERRDHATHRVERAHHVLDRAVLARRIDPLEDDENPLTSLGPDPILETRQSGEARIELLRRGRLRVAVDRRRIDRGEIDARAGVDAESVAKAGGRSGHRL